MKRFILLSLACVMLAGCYNADNAKHALEAEGFTDIHILGYANFACSDEFYSTAFEATNPKGKRVHGVVCSDPFINSTVRW